MKKIFFIALSLTFSAISFSQSKKAVRLRVNIANRKGDVIYIKDKYFDDRVEVQLNSEGYFESTFELEEGMYRLYDDVDYADIYLEKGYNLTLNVDDDKFAESVFFAGEGAEENNYLAKYRVENEEFKINNPYLFDLGEAEFRKVIYRKRDADIKRLNEKRFKLSVMASLEENIYKSISDIMERYLEVLSVKKLKNTVPPSFNFVDINGRNAKLEDFKGKYVYISVWNTLAGLYFDELPYLTKLHEQYRDKNIAFVNISTNTPEEKDKWEAMVKSTQMGGVNLLDNNKSPLSPLFNRFKITHLPWFILLDPEGRIVNADAETPSCPTINIVLDSLLK